MIGKRPVHDMVNRSLFLYTFNRKKVQKLESYDNDFLFMDDDLFLLVVPYDEIENDPNYTMIFIVDGDE